MSSRNQLPFKKMNKLFVFTFAAAFSARKALPIFLIILLAILVSPVLEQTSSAATQQIGPGSTSGISPGGTVAPGDKAHRLLKGALTPETRQTLQQAMNSSAQPSPAK
jgi:chromate transport protein ChrA